MQFLISFSLPEALEREKMYRTGNKQCTVQCTVQCTLTRSNPVQFLGFSFWVINTIPSRRTKGGGARDPDTAKSASNKDDPARHGNKQRHHAQKTHSQTPRERKGKYLDKVK